MALHYIFNNILRYDIRGMTRGSLVSSSAHRFPSHASSLVVLVSCLLYTLSPIACLLSLAHRLHLVPIVSFLSLLVFCSSLLYSYPPHSSFLPHLIHFLLNLLFFPSSILSLCLAHDPIFHDLGCIFTEIRALAKIY